MPWVEGEGGVLYYYFITKPLWLVSFLNALSWDIFTWHIDVGAPIETAADWIIGWINDIADWVQQFWAWAEEFRQEVIDFFTQIPEWINQVWQFIQNVWDSIAGIIDNWWSGMVDTVQGWVDVAKDFVLGLIDDLKGIVTRVDVALSNFFTVTLPTLASKFDVTEIIKGFLDPFRDVFNFIEMVKGELIKFFNDPWAWLYDKFDEFFERFW
jgi:phage-related protein